MSATCAECGGTLEVHRIGCKLTRPPAPAPGAALMAYQRALALEQNRPKGKIE